MKKLIIIGTALIFLLNTSCKKTAESPIINAFGFTTLEEAEKNLGQYAKAFYVVDGSIYTRLENFSANKYYVGIISAWYTGGFNAPRSNGGTYYLDDVEYYFDDAKQMYMVKGLENDDDMSLMGARVKKMYGKQVKSKLIREGKEIFNTSYYVPADFDMVVSNPIMQGSSFYQISEEKGLNLKWKKDDNNKNGVVIHVSWTGDRLDLPLNAQGTAGQLQFATKVEDTGEITLPIDFFSKLPKDAIFSLNVIRGNIEIIEGTDRKQYKVYNQVEEKLSCVLN
jgi:hypothetical protein